MAHAFIGLGSNLGDRQAQLEKALQEIGRLPQTKVIGCSGWHETDPVGGPPQGKFINGVVHIETSLKPLELLGHLQKIESLLGRSSKRTPWGAREIDLDLISCDELLIKNEQLELPHPQMHKRLFVLIPLAEIAPDWRHPRLGLSVQQMIDLLQNADRPAA